MKKNLDLQVFEAVLLHTKEYLKFNTNSSIKALDILEAIVDDTLDKLRGDVSNVKIAYDYSDLYDYGWPEKQKLDLSSLRSLIRPHCKKIIELVDVTSDLSLFLKNKGLDAFLTFESNESKGGAGARNLMWLGLTDSCETTKEEGLALYRAVGLKKPFFWVQPITNIALKGKGILLFTLVPAFALVGIPFLLFSLTQIQTFVYIMFVIICIFLLWRIVYIIYELMEKGVSKTPDWMIRFSDRNALFVVNREISTDKEKRGAKIIELITYEAECPICSDIIFIERGSKEFSGRYIGKCTLAPKEHVFSFDHITKQGKHLR
ncbi:MAG: hypothetical protein ABJH06_11975 [Paraglaciecola sp.]|uniref:hypothetical protein n=1 Tax=Paraglaciecola sp. TaxID=1920173 RepID=UPI00329710BB